MSYMRLRKGFNFFCFFDWLLVEATLGLLRFDAGFEWERDLEVDLPAARPEDMMLT